MPKSSVPLGEFVCAVYELAVAESAQAWLTAVYGATDYDVPVLSGRRIATGHRGTADVVDGRVTGTWAAVVGAEWADGFLLTAGPNRVLVPRDAVHVEPIIAADGLVDTGIGTVVASGAAIDEVLPGAPGTALLAGATAAVVGSAAGVWRQHVEQARTRLAIAHSGDEASDAAHVARAASDIDAARLQFTGAITEPEAGNRPFVQAIARARAATDHLMDGSRHALDAMDPVARRWRAVQAGCRLAARLLA
jgi:3-hydroxy-9,10-secoandrosta-1,3,5(10)-triene-9,17-dione monooxygenase